MLYTAGRGWIEYLRIDSVQMDDVLGLRLNVWTSIVLFVLAAAFYAWSTRRHPGREESVRTRPLDMDEKDDDEQVEPADADDREGAGPTA
jgi:prolipoprotein diacylglyceryltransferase